MKGSTVSSAEKRFHDALCRTVGCIACRVSMGVVNTHVSVHHIDGRTKPGAHLKVLPLCGSHHQDDGREGFHAVHPWKRRFEQAYGTQASLLDQCHEILEQAGFTFREDLANA